VEAKWHLSILTTHASLHDPQKTPLFDEYASKGAHIIIGELDKPETYQDKIKGIEVLVSAVSGRAIKSQIPLIHAAKHAGVKLFVPSEFAFDFEKHKPTKSFVQKTEIQEEVKKAGLHYSLIVTGLFYEYFLYPYFKTDIKNKQVAQYGDRSTKISACSLPEFGSLLPHILNDPTSLNKTVSLSGDQTTTGHIADEWVSLAGGDAKVVQYNPKELLDQINANPNGFTIPEEIMLVMAKGESFFENPIDGSKYGKKLSSFHQFTEAQKKKQ